MSLETRLRSMAGEPVLGHDDLDAALHGATSLGHRKVVRRRAGMAAMALVLAVGVGAGIVAATGADKPAETNVANETPSTTEPPDDPNVVPTTTTTTTAPDPGFTSAVPKAGEPIVNGRYYGGIRSVDTEAREITFDVAQWFEGDAAYEAAKADDDEANNDYYVRNNSTEVRTLSVAPDAKLTVERQPGDKESVSLSGLAARVRETSDGVWGWVTMRNGEVTLVEEQWVP